MENLALAGFYLNPVFAVVFCINLVSLIKKVKSDKETKQNTIWISVSFAYIVFSISLLILITE